MTLSIRMALTGGLVAIALIVPDRAFGQGTDAALRDRVAQLVEKLEASKLEARDAAEKALIGLGPRALPFLPDASKGAADRNKRLDRVREALRHVQDATNLGASKVTIRGEGIRLSEAIKQLQSQSGNVITDLREQFGADVTNPALDLNIVDEPFLEALDQVAAKAEVRANFYTGDGSVGLIAGAEMMPGQADSPEKPNPFRIYTGPFRVVLKQVLAKRDFQSGAGLAEAQFEVDWEPRLRPMLLAMKAQDVKIMDDRGKEVAPSVNRESTSVVLRPENPSANVNLTMIAPDREALALAGLKVKAELTIPAAIRTFTFPNLAAGDVKQSQGDITVTLESTEADEGVWKVDILVEFPGEGPAFESYRQGLFNNRLWLQTADGSRVEQNGGFSQTSSDGGRLGFQYLFVDVPGKPADYQFVYETPSKVVTVPLEFEFKDVPLP